MFMFPLKNLACKGLNNSSTYWGATDTSSVYKLIRRNLSFFQGLVQDYGISIVNAL